MNLSDIGIHLPVVNPTWIFFLVLMIILFAPILLGRLRIPHIIGMILAGVVVGKYGLNILERDSSFELFGKVGIYYIMFLAGLEMDLENLKKNIAKATNTKFLFIITQNATQKSCAAFQGYYSFKCIVTKI